jgi:eukaryotic-like serine/threonine-protein kinase
MSFVRFLRSSLFWRHTAIAVVVTIVLVWLVLKLLDLYTRHGSSIVVPDFKGVHITALDDMTSEYRLEYAINDSLYDFSMPKGTVVIQDPLPGTKVKKNRKIYFTVVAQKPEQVSMPNLVDLTLRQATAMLETYGLKVGNLSYVPDIAHNAVLKQKFKGQEITEGTTIEKGSSIDLVLGQGADNNRSTVPDLYGLKQSQALKRLQLASLNIGSEIFEDGNDTTTARVYKQHPAKGSGVMMGGQVDLWYRSDKKHDFNNNKGGNP